MAWKSYYKNKYFKKKKKKKKIVEKFKVVLYFI